MPAFEYLALNGAGKEERGIMEADTPRQVRQLLGCDSKKACRLLEHLVSAGAVKNIGQRRHPVYVMEPGGEAGIKPMPVERQRSNIAEVCRQN